MIDILDFPIPVYHGCLNSLNNDKSLNNAFSMCVIGRFVFHYRFIECITAFMSYIVQLISN